MAQKPLVLPDTEVNPTFFIPAGTQGMVYDTESLEVRVVDDNRDQLTDIVVDIDDSDENIDVLGDSFGGLSTPAITDISSQIIRIADAGQMVVDVVLEATDIAGATNYEVRVTKV